MDDGVNGRRSALVLSGGGARAAYQAGALRYLARRFPGAELPIVTGVSAGAINAAILASAPSLGAGAARLCELWAALHTRDVFQSDALYLAGNAVRWGARLLSGGIRLAGPVRGLVDTAPLRSFLRRAVDVDGDRLTGVARSIADGRLDALALTTTNYATGQAITWCESRKFQPWVRPHRKAVAAELTIDHVLASAALPLLFPAVEIDGVWHGDGGIRLTAPLSPALHLGARRILAISARYERSEAEADRPAVWGYPPPAQVFGVLMNAIFLDMLDADAHAMERVNRLLDRFPEAAGEGLQRIDLLVLRPSQDLGRIAAQCESALPLPLRFMARGAGSHESESADALSMLLFEPEYTQRLLALGEADAAARERDLAAFLQG